MAEVATPTEKAIEVVAAAAMAKSIAASADARTSNQAALETTMEVTWAAAAAKAEVAVAAVAAAAKTKDAKAKEA